MAVTTRYRVSRRASILDKASVRIRSGSVIKPKDLLGWDQPHIDRMVREGFLVPVNAENDTDDLDLGAKTTDKAIPGGEVTHDGKDLMSTEKPEVKPGSFAFDPKYLKTMTLAQLNTKILGIDHTVEVKEFTKDDAIAYLSSDFRGAVTPTQFAQG